MIYSTDPKDNPVYFDVDDTLVLWYTDHGNSDRLLFVDNGEQHWLVPHKKHIEQLKLHKANGQQVIVWSQRGYKWCQEVVSVLGLDQYVDHCLTKPMMYYDDLDCKEFMGERTYFKYE